LIKFLNIIKYLLLNANKFDNFPKAVTICTASKRLWSFLPFVFLACFTKNQNTREGKMNKKIKNLMKRFVAVFGVLACLMLFQTISVNAQVDDAILTAEASNPDNTESAEIGIPNWKIFENAVAKVLTGTVYAQVYLDTYDSKGAKAPIIPDYLQVMSNGNYKVVDAKASSITDLTTMDLTSKCTTNQKAMYPLINAGVITTKVLTARNSLDGTKKLAAGATIKLEIGVQFYVNNPKGQYTVAKPRSLQ
jgi:hypothetical protein